MKAQIDLRPWYRKQEHEYNESDWRQLRDDVLEYLESIK